MRSARRLVTGGVLALLGAVTVAATPATAHAQDPEPNQITVVGDGLPEPVVVRAEERPELAAALHTEVDWLQGRSGDAEAPEEEKLGPAYTLEVHVDGEARHRYVLYPLAEGGPRVHRPDEQPNERKTSEAWFFGRLSMKETLAAAGVPIPGVQPRLPGGSGGGNDAGSPSPGADATIVDAWREGMQLNTAVIVVISAGLAGVALLIRRKV